MTATKLRTGQITSATPDAHKTSHATGGSDALTASDVGATTNPMTTQDDLILGGASGVPGRLAKGSDGQVLTVNPSTHHVDWENSASGFSNPMTTAGDLILGDTGGAAIRLPKGSDGDVLVVDPSTHLPVWDAPTGGGSGALTLISDQLLGSAAASVSFTSIAASWKDLVLICKVLHASSSAGNYWLRMNADTGSNYEWYYRVLGTGASSNSGSSSDTKMPLGDYGNGAGHYGQAEVLIADYVGTVMYKSYRANASFHNGTAGPAIQETGGAWKSASAVTRLDILPDSGNFATGSRFTLYGRG